MTGVIRKLDSILNNKKNFSGHKIIMTLKQIMDFDYVFTDASLDFSVILLEKLVYFCNSNLKKHVFTRLQTSKNLLGSWITSAKINRIPVPEQLIKLLAITYLDLSIFFENIKHNKSVKFAIEATKLTISYKLKTNRGRLLKFLCRLRLSELYIISGKFELSIGCCENLLEEVLARLVKVKKKRAINELAMTSITAFFRIGMCNKLLERHDVALGAFKKAETIGKEYLRNSEILNDLEYESKLFANIQIKKPKTLSSQKCLSPSNSTQKALTPKNSFFSNIQSYHSRPSSKKLLTASRSFEILPKPPKKYYSTEKLMKLNNMMESEESEKIFTTDQFFYKKMTKKLGVDLKSQSPSRDSSSLEILNLQKSEINKLKDRRLFKGAKTEYCPENIERKIEKFEENCEKNLKLQEIKMKSTLKTKVYKNILKTINLRFNSGEKLMPVQRLFFEPPSTKFIQPAKGKEKIKRRMTIVDRRVRDFNLEIEEHIGQLNKELNNSDVAGKLKNRILGEGKLAKSTLKSKVKTKHIKNTMQKIFLSGKLLK